MISCVYRLSSILIDKYWSTGTTTIEGFTIADAIFIGKQGKQGKIYSECMGKMVILMLDNLKKFDILQFL